MKSEPKIIDSVFQVLKDNWKRDWSEHPFRASIIQQWINSEDDHYFQEERMSNVMVKYYLRGLPFFATLHHFTGPDIGHPHDHPFKFVSFVLKGEYIELRYKIYNISPYGWSTELIKRKEGDSFDVGDNDIHKIVELPKGECWTLIITEREERKWGFYKFGEEILHRYWDETEFKKLII